MSLLDAVDPAHAPALKRFAARLRAGGEEERAVLMNLQEEDRVPDGKRAAFQAKLSGSKRRAWKDRFADASQVALRTLSVGAARPTTMWWHHVTLAQLQRFQFVSFAMKASRPPRRLPLLRPVGRPARGMDRIFWITDATHPSADDIRNHLGLCLIPRGEELYRVRIGASAAGRPLYVPSALDAGFYPAWRRPNPAHASGWGMTRHLETDACSQPELLAFPDAADERSANHVGPVQTDPPRGYLRARGIP